MSNTTTVPPPPFEPPIAIFLGVLAILVSVITVGGNLLVVVAFFVERALRTPTNYFIASLAVTDLLIGGFSMNFYTLYLLLGTWPLGEMFCDLWLSLDYTACLTSQYTVFFITVDRYCSVKIPAKYRNWRTERRVLIMVVATWLIPSSIFFTSIMGWPYFTSRSRVATDCYAEFTNYPVFNTVLTIGYFWITLVVMCTLYAGIYHVALNLQRKSDAKRRKVNNLVVTVASQNKAVIKNNAEGEGNKIIENMEKVNGNVAETAIVSKTKNVEDITESENFLSKKSQQANDTDSSMPSDKLLKDDVAPQLDNQRDAGEEVIHLQTVQNARIAAAATANWRKRLSMKFRAGRSSSTELAGPNSNTPVVVSTPRRKKGIVQPPSRPFTKEVVCVDSDDNERSSSPMLPSDSDNEDAIPYHAPKLVDRRKKSTVTDANDFKSKPKLGKSSKHKKTDPDSTSMSSIHRRIVSPTISIDQSSPKQKTITEKKVRRKKISAPAIIQHPINFFTQSSAKPSSAVSSIPENVPSIQDLNQCTTELPSQYIEPVPNIQDNNSHLTPTSANVIHPSEEQTRLQAPYHGLLLPSGAILTDSVEGLRYIDQESIRSMYSAENMRHLVALQPPIASSESFNQPHLSTSNSVISPIWKKRPDENLIESNESDLRLPAPQENNQTLHSTLTASSTAPIITTEKVTLEASPSSVSPEPIPCRSTEVSIGLDSDIRSDRKTGGMSQSNSRLDEDLTATDSATCRSARFSHLTQVVAARVGLGRVLGHPVDCPTLQQPRKEKIERGRTENRARKALRTITFILGAFVMCWTPYHVFVLVKGFCDTDNYKCINQHLYNLSYWLCYMNSPINPFCYALANAQFKKTFLRILRRDFHRT